MPKGSTGFLVAGGLAVVAFELLKSRTGHGQAMKYAGAAAAMLSALVAWHSAKG